MRGEYKYTINLDIIWINEIDRSFPITLSNPLTSINVIPAGIAVISSLSPGQNFFNPTNLGVGATAPNNATRTFMRFNIPNTPCYMNYAGAWLNIRRSVASPADSFIHAQIPNVNWHPNSITWNNRPTSSTNMSMTNVPSHVGWHIRGVLFING